MKIFSNKVGHPTIVVAFLILIISFISIFGSFNYYKTVGGGHAYIRLTESGVPNIQASKEAKRDGLISGILMIFGINIPVTLLFLIAIGLISKTTDILFKRTLRILYIIIVGVGVFLLALGIPYYQEIQFPITIGTSLLLYFIISAILWTIIGIGILIRGKQNA